jgi:hypothetical protein
MSKMSDLYLEILSLIEEGKSDFVISETLNVPMEWICSTREDYERETFEEYGEPTWEQEWADFGESYD